MNRDNNFDVKGWMVLELGLKGNELMAFAIVWGFSQDGESEFKGSVSYIRKFLSVSKPTAIKILVSLEEKGFILCRKIESKHGTKNLWRANIERVKKFNQGGKETLPLTGKETLPKNIHIENIQGNNREHPTFQLQLIDQKKEKKTQAKETPDFPPPENDWVELWGEWMDYRRAQKIKAWARPIDEQRAVNKLVNLSNGDIEVAKKVILQSIENGYTGLFKLKNQNNGTTNDEIRRLAGF